MHLAIIILKEFVLANIFYFSCSFLLLQSFDFAQENQMLRLRSAGARQRITSPLSVGSLIWLLYYCGLYICNFTLKLIAVFKFAGVCNCLNSAVGEIQNNGIEYCLEIVNFKSNANKYKDIILILSHDKCTF